MEYSTKRKGIIIISCVAATAIVGVTVLWVINRDFQLMASDRHWGMVRGCTEWG